MPDAAGGAKEVAAYLMRPRHPRVAIRARIVERLQHRCHIAPQIVAHCAQPVSFQGPQILMELPHYFAAAGYMPRFVDMMHPIHLLDQRMQPFVLSHPAIEVIDELLEDQYSGKDEERVELRIIRLRTKRDHAVR